jgi:hypothetical protein
MATLLIDSVGDRRCDAKCHNATESGCDCVCEGRYHGASTAGAREAIRRDLAAGLFTRSGELGHIAPCLTAAAVQPSLFDRAGLVVGSPADESGRIAATRAARDDYEIQDPEYTLSDAADFAGAVLHWFGVKDGDMAFGALVVEQLRRVAEFVHTQPCRCPADVVETGEVCGRCRALCRVADQPEM